MVNASAHVQPSRALVEAASWALACHLTRRHPGLSIIRYRPGGGQYDCLGIRSVAGLNIDLNRVGRIHVHAGHAGVAVDWEPVEWVDYLAGDPREFSTRLERVVGLPKTRTLPPTTPRVLTYRLLAAFARLNAFARPVDITMSAIDSTGMDSGPADWLTDYPSVARRTSTSPFGFWHAQSRETELVIETESATLHRRDGSTRSLTTLYNDEGRAFERLLGRVLTDQ